jgi:hypothetical protein
MDCWQWPNVGASFSGCRIPDIVLVDQRAS